MKEHLTGQCLLLIKFNDYCHLNPFYESGLIYMNPLSFFQKPDNKIGKNDKNENITRIIHADNIFIDGKPLKLSPPLIMLYDSNEDPYKMTHIFSMISICEGDDIRNDGILLDNRVQKLGDSFIVIYNVEKFFTQLLSELKKLYKSKVILGYKTDRITYINENNYQKKMTPFHKFEHYSWQKEWRLAISAPDIAAPFKLNIGSIKEISRIQSTKKFQNKILIE